MRRLGSVQRKMPCVFVTEVKEEPSTKREHQVPRNAGSARRARGAATGGLLVAARAAFEPASVSRRGRAALQPGDLSAGSAGRPEGTGLPSDKSVTDYKDCKTVA